MPAPAAADPFAALSAATAPADLEAPPPLPTTARAPSTPSAIAAANANALLSAAAAAARAPSTPCGGAPAANAGGGGSSLGRPSGAFHPHTGKLLMAPEPLVRVVAVEDEHPDLPVRAFLSPPETFAHVATAGVDKKRAGPVREGVLGLLAGSFIGLGFSLCMSVGGQLSPDLRHEQPGLFSLVYGAFGFPFGLTLCVVCGASLFTSNVGYMTAAVFERRCSLLSAVRVCVYSYFTNAFGALALAQLYVWGQVFGGGKAAFVLELAAKKTSNPWSVAFVRGILCNYLVVLAVWQANAAQDVASKAVAVFLPISAFVALGFEHCIANLFGLPLALMLQNGPGGEEAVAAVAAHSLPVPGVAPPRLTAARIVSRNIVPVTLGNVVGGGLFVATAYAFAFGAPGRAADAWLERQWARLKAAVVSAIKRRRQKQQQQQGQHQQHQQQAQGRVGSGGAGSGGGGGGGSGRGLLDHHHHHHHGQQKGAAAMTNRKPSAPAPAVPTAAAGPAANGTAAAAASAAVLPPPPPATNGAVHPVRVVRISSDGDP